MDSTELKPILEALIFASEEPISSAGLAAMLEETGAGRGDIQKALRDLQEDYTTSERGLMLREVGGGYQFVTKPDTAAWVQKLSLQKPKTLSQAALETLAIVAYRQPIVRAEVDAIRGVDSGGVLKTLLERGLLKILGRREEAGQPLIYGTTGAFLELFHLTRLEELPSMRDIEEMIQSVQEEKGEGVEQDPEDQIMPMAAVLPVSEEELAEEGRVMEALESSLKDLRKLDNEIFSKEEDKSEEVQTEEEERGGHDENMRDHTQEE